VKILVIALPVKNNLSPQRIITGSKIEYNQHCRLQFGTYVQMHEQHINSLLPRMDGAIALYPQSKYKGATIS